MERESKRFWRQQCEQLLLHETTLEERDTEIVCLKKKLAGDDRRSRETSMDSTPIKSTEEVGWQKGMVVTQGPPYRGNALFTREALEAH